MATTDIGRVTPIWRGFFSVATTYELNDIVIDTDGSVWWHKSPAQTTGVIPETGEIWDAVIDMSIFSGLIQAAITTAQTALAAAQEAVAEVTADTERAETAARNAEVSALSASESAASVGAYAQAAEDAKNAAQTAASQAAASASSAGTSAASAGSSAQAAETSKTAAQTAATQAAGSAETASGAAAVVEQKKAEAIAAIEAKGEEVLESIPEDYTELSGDVGEIKESTDIINNQVFKETAIIVAASPTGWRLNETDGLCASNPNYKLIKYEVFAGTYIRVISDDRFQFQNSATVPSSGESKRVGDTTYGKGIFRLPVPDGATYLIMSSPVADSIAAAYTSEGIADAIEGLEESVNLISSVYNFYDPKATYTQTNGGGASRNGYTINPDGSISCIRTQGSYGALYLVDSSRTLKAGTYTISGKFTFTNPENTSRNVALNVGRSGATVNFTLRTSRGGNTYIESGTAEGWFAYSISVAEDETFAFAVMPWTSGAADATYPAVISELMINEGSVLADYSTVTLTANDVIARKAADEIHKKAVQEFFSSKNLIGLKGGVLYPVHLSAGTTLTMSTADKEKLNTTNFNLIFYDIDKNPTGQTFNFSQGVSYRTVTISYECYYIAWNKDAPREVQVEIGDTRTDYVPYSINIRSEELAAELLSSLGGYLTADQIFNGEPYTGAYDYNTPLTAYGALFNAKSVVESFAFFTDPHILGFDDDERNDVRKENYLKRVQKTYNNSPCSFLVCGGDWLNNDTTPAEACYRLGNLKGIADHLLGGCKLVIGNHDVNEQGIAEEGSARGTGVLADSVIASLMFRDTDTKKAYYSFDGANSKCYVLDTGRAGSYHSAMLDYDWEQIDWLAGKLAEDDPEHGIIFLHTIYNGTVDSPRLQINAVNFGTLVEAYNSRNSVILNEKTYNFTACTGRIEFWVAGHTHRDEIGTLGGIPYISTATNSYDSDVPLIDLMLADYVGRKLYTVRVGGTGENRIIDLDA